MGTFWKFWDFFLNGGSNFENCKNCFRFLQELEPGEITRKNGVQKTPIFRWELKMCMLDLNLSVPTGRIIKSPSRNAKIQGGPNP